MRFANINWLDIKPTESARAMSASLAEDISEKIAELKRGKEYPLLAVSYKNNTSILVDGHRRAIAHLLLGNIELPTTILETDSDIRNYGNCDFFTSRTPRIETIETLYHLYETEILPSLESARVRKFTDYEIFKVLMEKLKHD